MIANPLWSCVMLLCGPLRYLVIPLVEGGTDRHVSFMRR